MEYVRLGKSDLLISRVAMGVAALVKSGGEAGGGADFIRSAYDSGINFFDTSGKDRDGERLLGSAVGDIRRNVVIATKTDADSGAEILSDAEASLAALCVDSIDLFQYEAETFVPEKNGRDGIYTALDGLKSSGKIRHIGFVTTDLETAERAVRTGLYETLQFPFSMISAENTIDLVRLCGQTDTGFIAMQPLCGGLVENIPLAFGFLRQYENVIPLWGVRTRQELEQILYFNARPPVIDEKFKEDVERLRLFFN